VTELLDFPALKPRDFERICDLAYQRCGLNLKDGKQRLVSSRLSKLMRDGGFRTFDKYYEHVVNDPSGGALVAMIDRLTTNHTNFLREAEHFRFLSNCVPEFARCGTLRVWSAACSSGEEPYSILFTLLSLPPGKTAPTFDITATDISTRVLTTARSGIYAAERIAPLPPDWISRFFSRPGGALAGSFQVKPEFVRQIRFERINLVDSFPSHNPYHIIFCRNVMIYFDRGTRANLVNRLASCLEPGGYLFVGHAESLIGLEHTLTYICPAVYQKRQIIKGDRRA
jgi:chemotaxis protein methyltransferase CheR